MINPIMPNVTVFMTSRENASGDLACEEIIRYPIASQVMYAYILIGLSSIDIGSSAIKTITLVAGIFAFLG